MKYKYLILISSLLLNFTIQAQDTCKVLTENLKGFYEGGCKKGLANGIGKAKGIDSYSGSFKKGYPNGHGSYIWANGAFYEGNWKMGARDGEGKYTYSENGEKKELNGIWRNDKYVGVKPKPPIIMQKRNVTGISFVRAIDGDKITIKILQSGIAHSVDDLFADGSSGYQNINGSLLVFEKCEFPFTCIMTYKSWNQLKTILYDRSVQFEILQSGNWEVKIEN